MNSRIASWLVWLAVPGFCFGVEKERSFRSAAGQEIKATFQGLSGDVVTLLRSDGKSFELALDRLSKEDQEYVKKAALGSVEDAEKLNKAAGLPISNGKPFSEQSAEEVAKALKLRPESQSKYGKSWRLYASFVEGYTLFGAMPYSVALYSDGEGKLESVSIVYANKGDFGSTAGFARDHFKNSGTTAPGTLDEAMKLDEKRVTESLSSVFGEPKTQRYGDSGTRRTIQRWDWNGHSFILSHEPEEYISLTIVSQTSADGGGRTARMSDSDLKKRLIESVVTEENGDVRITEIPMVDQGPKGYCVPATFERAMRTMGIEADMYLMAMVGQSKAGGGTVVEVLLENMRSAVYRKGRRTKEEVIKSIAIRDVKRQISQGIPIIWTMHSVDEYNDLAGENTAGRDKGDEAFRLAMSNKAKELQKQEKPGTNLHVCMIIGYNETTQEIAVSDSWGPRYELRWIPVEAADWVSAGKFFMILP